MNIPCKECLLISVCRHKSYPNLFESCSLIKEYIPNQFSFHRDIFKVCKLEKILTPSKWYTKNYYIILLKE